MRHRITEQARCVVVFGDVVKQAIIMQCFHIGHLFLYHRKQPPDRRGNMGHVPQGFIPAEFCQKNLFLLVLPAADDLVNFVVFLHEIIVRRV